MQIWGEKRETLQERNDDVLGFFFSTPLLPPQSPSFLFKGQKTVFRAWHH